jgi:putative membrane protein
MMGWNTDPASWLWMAIWIVALLAMVWLVIRSVPGRPQDEDALAILRARYARGEISEVEYERARATLIGDQSSEATKRPMRG